MHGQCSSLPSRIRDIWVGAVLDAASSFSAAFFFPFWCVVPVLRSRHWVLRDLLMVTCVFSDALAVQDALYCLAGGGKLFQERLFRKRPFPTMLHVRQGEGASGKTLG